VAQSIRDKTPPHDDELEQAALGSLLADSDAVAAAIQFHLTYNDFYSRANSRIFEAIMSLDAKGLRPDIQTVVQELKLKGKLDEAGGASYVSSLTTVIPSSANIEYYAQMVKNYSVKRSLLGIASEIGVNVYDESKEAADILNDVQSRIFTLSDERQVFTSSKISEVLKETIMILDNVMKSKNPITGISTGFEELDRMTAGFQREEFIVIGARPSVGKTALALNMASFMAFHKEIPIAFFSLEMSSIALAQRIISSEAMVQAQNLRSGFLSRGDYKNIVDKMSLLYEGPFYIVDIPNMKLSDLRTQARKLVSQQKVEIIFIDYLGLIADENYRGGKRFEQISEISRSLKSLARELHIPIVVLCQLNREAQWETPTLANLRDSGSIEQDADLVLLLHREHPKKNKKDKEEEKPVFSDKIPTDLKVEKQRNGPTGIIKLEMIAKYAKFQPALKSNNTEQNT